MSSAMVPQTVWLTDNCYRGVVNDDSWSATMKSFHVASNSIVRFTAGNKKYALLGSRFGEFDSTKKVISDVALYKKYR